MVKGKEDTNTYNVPPTTPWQEINPRHHRWQIVKVDSNRKIQGFISDPTVDFKLIGYTIGSDPKFFTTPIDITPPGVDQWTGVSIAQYLDADTDGVILFIDSIANNVDKFGIGEVSCISDDERLPDYGNTMWLVGLNEFDQFKAKIKDPNEYKLYLVAQTKGSAVFYCLDILTGDPPAFGSWQLMDADVYGVAAAANGLIFQARGKKATDKNELGLRHGDNTTDDWNKELANTDDDRHLQAVAGINAANQWYEWKEHKDIRVWITGYTRRVNLDVHADVDIVIRKADGAIRTTLATNVSNTGNITSETWQTMTVTYAFPGYTIVDPTDYLEIDIFAESTSNDSTETVSVEFRIDDPTLALADQMGVVEVVP